MASILRSQLAYEWGMPQWMEAEAVIDRGDAAEGRVHKYRLTMLVDGYFMPIDFAGNVARARDKDAVITGIVEFPVGQIVFETPKHPLSDQPHRLSIAANSHRAIESRDMDRGGAVGFCT
jgi:hypothetical protein